MFKVPLAEGVKSYQSKKYINYSSNKQSITQRNYI